MSDHDKMLERVRALLAKAESTTYAEEAEAFTGKAQELMARYAIDEAMLARSERRRETVGRITIVCDAPYADTKTVLVNGIAQANGCRAVRVERGATQRLEVFGLDSDLRWVETLYTSLLVQAAGQLGNSRPGRSRYLGRDVGAGDVKAYRRAFMFGFAAAVRQRLEAANATARAEADDQTSVALVLASKDELVEAAMRDAHPNMRTQRSRTTLSSGDGYRAGQQAGRNANLARSGIGGRRAIGA